MRYAPPGLCLNDFAIVTEPLADSVLYHAVHLQAPPVEPFDAAELETSFGHAVSDDLVSWCSAGTIFGIGEPGRFDDSAIWTMCHVRHDILGYCMFYTGVTMRPYAEQSVGIAQSTTGRVEGPWRRYGDAAVSVADPQWYRTDKYMGWRDPFVVRDDMSGHWVMYVAARSRDIGPEHGGCVGAAISLDLINWIAQPPVIADIGRPELECPVLLRLDDRLLLVVSMSDTHGVEIFEGDSYLGPFTSLGELGPRGAYAPRFVERGSDTLMVHTLQRRHGQTNDGSLCRGVIAQPKVIKRSGVGYALYWWHTGLDKHLGPETDEDLTSGVATAHIPANTSAVTVTFDPIGHEICWGTALSITALDGTVDIRSTEPVPSDAGELKVLFTGEFVEIYWDDRLVGLGLAYPAGPKRVAAAADHTPIPTVTRPIFTEATAWPRDDVSAVW